MTTIKPAGAVTPGAPATPVEGGAPTKAAGAVAPARGAGVDPTAAVLGELRAGRITPDEAVAALTRAAIEKTGCPAAMRPSIERKMQALLARDPTLGALMAQMGARGVDPR